MYQEKTGYSKTKTITKNEYWLNRLTFTKKYSY